MSLQHQLQTMIKERGYVPYFEIKNFVENGEAGKYYKISNAERRLRPSESPMIETEYKDGHIVGYRFKEVKQVSLF